MTDTSLTDMAPFFERHDRRSRLIFVAAISASLVMSAVIFAHGPPTIGGTGVNAPVVQWWFGILFTPVFLVGWYGFGELLAIGRRKASLPDGRQPAGAEDARNGRRIANAGFAYTLALTVNAVIQQALWVPFVFGYRVAIGEDIARATMVAVGAATIYLGNVWPRMPTPRAPERTAAIRMKANRFIGWFVVMFGLLVLLLGLFLPLLMHHRP
jgi:hypothetical protein